MLPATSPTPAPEQLHAKKLSAMRQAYTQEIEELHDWTAALEDTLTNLVRSHGPCAVVGASLQESMRALTKNGSSAAPAPAAIPGLSSPNMRVLAQVMQRTPVESSCANAAHNAGKAGRRSEPALRPGTKGIESGAADVRILELERQLQDLTENFVKQMCELQEENHHLRNSTQRCSTSAVPCRDEDTGKINLKTMQGSASDNAARENHTLQKQVDQLNSLVDTLTTQLTDRDQELAASKALNQSMQGVLEHARKKERQWASRIDEEVDQALWSLNELSLDRARHSLERSQVSTHVKKLNDLNEVTQKPLVFIRANHLQNALNIQEPAEGLRSMRVDADARDNKSATKNISRVTHAAGAAVKIPASVGAKPRSRQTFGTFMKDPLDGIPEGNEESSHTVKEVLGSANVLNYFDAHGQLSHEMEPEEPSLSVRCLSPPRLANTVPSCRQVTCCEFMGSTLESAYKRYDGDVEDLLCVDPLVKYPLTEESGNDQLPNEGTAFASGGGTSGPCTQWVGEKRTLNSVEGFNTNAFALIHAAPEKPPRPSVCGGAQEGWCGEDMPGSMSLIQDVLPLSYGIEAPPSTPVFDQRAETMQIPSPQPAPCVATGNCGANELFHDMSRGNLRNQTAEVTVLKALPQGDVRKGSFVLEMEAAKQESMSQGPHYINSQYWLEVQKFIEVSYNAPSDLEQTMVCSKAASRSADKPPLRPTNQQAPSGGKPRKPRPSGQDDMFSGGLAPGVPSAHAPSRFQDFVPSAHFQVPSQPPGDMTRYCAGKSMASVDNVCESHPKLMQSEYKVRVCSLWNTVCVQSYLSLLLLSLSLILSSLTLCPCLCASLITYITCLLSPTPQGSGAQSKTIAKSLQGGRDGESNTPKTLKSVASSRGSKSSMKKLISSCLLQTSRFISRARSMSPRAREPSPATRDTSPSARSACGSTSGRVEGNNERYSRKATCFSSEHNSSRKSSSRRPSDDNLDHDHMHRFLQQSLLAAQTAQEKQDATTGGPAQGQDSILKEANVNGTLLPSPNSSIQFRPANWHGSPSVQEPSRQHVTIDANRPPRIRTKQPDGETYVKGADAHDAGDHTANQSLQKHDVRSQSGERPKSGERRSRSPSFRSLTSVSNDRIM